MPYPELVISAAPRPGAGLSSRADVAVFVGLTARRATKIPEDVLDAIKAAGWAGEGPFAQPEPKVKQLLNIPVPVDSWELFNHLFGWNERPLAAGSAQRLPCPLGLAVRSFFAEGGVKAWVVRVGDPLPLLLEGGVDARQVKRRLVSWVAANAPPDANDRAPLIPGFRNLMSADPADPNTWRGAAHVWGVDEAAMLSLPDLPELFAGAPPPAPQPPAPPPPPEQFKPCAPPAPGYAPDSRPARPHVLAPRLDQADYAAWGEAIKQLLRILSPPNAAAHRRDVMLVASLPRPAAGVGDEFPDAEGRPLPLLDSIELAASGGRLLEREGIGSARLQLAYPWIKTAAAVSAPEGLEAPEGAVAGAIARAALAFGAFRSAADSALPSVLAARPALDAAAIRLGLGNGRADWLGDRLCLIARKPDGFALISDATMAADRKWRAGGVSRLMGIILRAARALGHDRLFEPSGPATWALVRLDLESLFERLRGLGALSGASAEEAYRVRCDRSTMSQADIDAGRMIASVAFRAAYPIQTIKVTLSLGGAESPSMLEST